MAAPEPEAKLEAVTPSRSYELPPESESDAPASTGTQELKPWEQHAAVINLPRYDYRASGSLLLRSHSGFLITCPIKREKSATKEAIPILEEYHANCCVSEHAEPCDVKNAIKKRKLCSEASGSLEEAVTNGNSSSVSESIGSTGNTSSPQSKIRETQISTVRIQLHYGATAYSQFKKLAFYQKKTCMPLCQSYSLTSRGARQTKTSL
uniref:Uncharacterized protein n=1 Tax=Zea mays TaxID=4577 RepID=A0A804PLF2_MAIZE